MEKKELELAIAKAADRVIKIEQENAVAAIRARNRLVQLQQQLTKLG